MTPVPMTPTVLMLVDMIQRCGVRFFSDNQHDTSLATRTFSMLAEPYMSQDVCPALAYIMSWCLCHYTSTKFSHDDGVSTTMSLAQQAGHRYCLRTRPREGNAVLVRILWDSRLQILFSATENPLWSNAIALALSYVQCKRRPKIHAYQVRQLRSFKIPSWPQTRSRSAPSTC